MQSWAKVSNIIDQLKYPALPREIQYFMYDKMGNVSIMVSYKLPILGFPKCSRAPFSFVTLLLLLLFLTLPFSFSFLLEFSPHVMGFVDLRYIVCKENQFLLTTYCAASAMELPLEDHEVNAYLILPNFSPHKLQNKK